MITVEEASQRIFTTLQPLPQIVTGLEQAIGSVLREPIVADRDLPPFDRATLDGVALSSSSFVGGQRAFAIDGVAMAGQAQAQLKDPAKCLEIMTGAPLPTGADCVVRVEEVEIADGIATIADDAEAVPRAGIHPIGSDSRAGDLLLEPGILLTAKEAAVAASVGKAKVAVSREPRIAIVATGDELVPIRQAPMPYQIRRSNDLTLSVALSRAGYPVAERLHLLDDPEAIERSVAQLLESSDVVVLAGGISKGKRDYLPAAFEKCGAKMHFQWVSQRPGKPMWFGSKEHSGGQCLIFALPGNPVSCFTCLHRYVLPALTQASGHASPQLRCAKLGQAIEFKPPLTWFLPAKISNDPAGHAIAEPLPFNTSGDFISVAKSDGFLELPKERAQFEQGEALPFHPWIA